MTPTKFLAKQIIIWYQKTQKFVLISNLKKTRKNVQKLSFVLISNLKKHEKMCRNSKFA
jgi:hypothetical protein